MQFLILARIAPGISTEQVLSYVRAGAEQSGNAMQQKLCDRFITSQP
jgi:hypothetical protein